MQAVMFQDTFVSGFVASSTPCTVVWCERSYMSGATRLFGGSILTAFGEQPIRLAFAGHWTIVVWYAAIDTMSNLRKRSNQSTSGPEHASLPVSSAIFLHRFRVLMIACLARAWLR